MLSTKHGFTDPTVAVPTGVHVRKCSRHRRTTGRPRLGRRIRM